MSLTREGFVQVSLRGSEPLLTLVDQSGEDEVVTHLVMTPEELITLALEALQTHKHATNPMGL